MSPLTTTDRLKLNTLYTSINKINIPECTDPDAKDMAQKVGEGLEIIKKAIKEVSTIIK